MLREFQEEFEFSSLSRYASKSRLTKGRRVSEEKCEIRTDFQRDRDRIIHSKAFRRMKHKTQVFISPEGDHYRTRLTHTLEVSQIARTIARALRLNEDLTEAIALGHDLGHTPFGHAGERALNLICPNGFEHNVQSLRVIDRLEKDGNGLNLTYEVRNGILNHRTGGNPLTMEGKIVRLSDKIAYINHDIDDAQRAGLLKESDIPKDIIEIIGNTNSDRLDTFIKDVIFYSMDKDSIQMSPTVSNVMADLRKFMFDNVYNDRRSEEESRKVEYMISGLFEYFMKNSGKMKNEFINLINDGENTETVVCDFIACMTDRYAVKLYSDTFIPASWGIY
ncbi:deoxyguanosinetriphosphate triphosphohydrolase [Lachnospiraceae bacterium NSJ-143]|nr:deoxyguanosinetriphosphate triphosphohydrolase [Lachnospiraceae bacterium NSJ-143]